MMLLTLMAIAIRSEPETRPDGRGTRVSRLTVLYADAKRPPPSAGASYMLGLRSWFQLHDMLRIFTGVPKILKDILISERQRLRM